MSSIASRGDTIQGTFKTAQRYPANASTSAPTTLFTTEVPAFWNKDQLAGLLQAKGVGVGHILASGSDGEMTPSPRGAQTAVVSRS
ncbi:MAG: hypothetical protein ACLP8S_04110 [Solirubrobacteraceae bacterium]